MYKNSIVGGTFDHFHLGHEKLLTAAFEASEKVTIGLTNSILYQNKLLADLIQDFAIRKERLEVFLNEKNYRDRAIIVPIDDIYGNTLQEADIEAIFVTEENLSNVDRINTKRQEIGFSDIKPILVAYVQAADEGNITSERIRKGEIDREGLVFATLFEHILTLPESLRPELQKPISVVVKDTTEVLGLIEGKIVITVGDIISSELKQAGILPAVSVIDFKTRRHAITHEEIANALHTENGQGTIDPMAVVAFRKAMKLYLDDQSPQTVIVNGEEDLLALPAILLAPLGSIVLYGQFGQGIVVNIVTEGLKSKIKFFVERFEE